MLLERYANILGSLFQQEKNLRSMDVLRLGKMVYYY